MILHNPPNISAVTTVQVTDVYYYLLLFFIIHPIHNRDIDRISNDYNNLFKILYSNKYQGLESDDDNLLTHPQLRTRYDRKFLDQNDMQVLTNIKKYYYDNIKDFKEKLYTNNVGLGNFGERRKTGLYRINAVHALNNNDPSILTLILWEHVYINEPNKNKYIKFYTQDNYYLNIIKSILIHGFRERKSNIKRILDYPDWVKLIEFINHYYDSLTSNYYIPTSDHYTYKYYELTYTEFRHILNIDKSKHMVPDDTKNLEDTWESILNNLHGLMVLFKYKAWKKIWDSDRKQPSQMGDNTNSKINTMINKMIRKYNKIHSIAMRQAELSNESNL